MEEGEEVPSSDQAMAETQAQEPVLARQKEINLDQVFQVFLAMNKTKNVEASRMLRTFLEMSLEKPENDEKKISRLDWSDLQAFVTGPKLKKYWKQT